MTYFIFPAVFFCIWGVGYAILGTTIPTVLCMLGIVMSIGIDDILKELRKG